MKLAIRPFEADDREALIGLWHVCGLDRPPNDPNDDIDRKLAHDPEHLLVAVDRARNHSIVGSVMVGYEGRRGWVNLLAADPAYQGNGIGVALMERAEEILRELGCPKVNLQIRTSNVGVIDYYKALGYTVDDAISMGKRL